MTEKPTATKTKTLAANTAFTKSCVIIHNLPNLA
jgi:hypothetical protein